MASEEAENDDPKPAALMSKQQATSSSSESRQEHSKSAAISTCNCEHRQALIGRTAEMQVLQTRVSELTNENQRANKNWEAMRCERNQLLQENKKLRATLSLEREKRKSAEENENKQQKDNDRLAEENKRYREQKEHGLSRLRDFVRNKVLLSDSLKQRSNLEENLQAAKAKIDELEKFQKKKLSLATNGMRQAQHTLQQALSKVALVDYSMVR